ncbi:hypothetical protein BRADI_1g33266v3 [Brachypodium distachyon]|uniref:Uncharacterized protein n=1 Tax=Brachypodium distachyon TaxID=15368 RepID=A0A2K2DMI3_BRADI|nr:hypothetical protein BRADI_1g33266v3 [Brachypodium distachyon]
METTQTMPPNEPCQSAALAEQPERALPVPEKTTTTNARGEAASVPVRAITNGDTRSPSRSRHASSSSRSGIIAVAPPPSSSPAAAAAEEPSGADMDDLMKLGKEIALAMTADQLGLEIERQFRERRLQEQEQRRKWRATRQRGAAAAGSAEPVRFFSLRLTDEEAAEDVAGVSLANGAQPEAEPLVGRSNRKRRRGG